MDIHVLPSILATRNSRDAARNEGFSATESKYPNSSHDRIPQDV
jgi:hypothetical protein